jgi:hypothetical protein
MSLGNNLLSPKKLIGKVPKSKICLVANAFALSSYRKNPLCRLRGNHIIHSNADPGQVRKYKHFDTADSWEKENQRPIHGFCFNAKTECPT